MLVHVSYLEVYNEVVYDLLSERKEASGPVTIMEEGCCIELKGLNQFYCDSVEAALKYFLRGEGRRSMGANTIHKMSNRSHCMFTIYIEKQTKARGFAERTAAKLNLVDLAGCEGIRGMDISRHAEKEVLSINKSLSFLKQAVSELRKGQGHVSFRQSRLTMLLKDALGGNSKTVLIFCTLQENDFLDESLSTLRFAQCIRDLKTSAVINKVLDSTIEERRQYERKIEELRRELALHDGRMAISRDDITEEKRIEQRSKIEDFLCGKEPVDAIPIESLAQMENVNSQNDGLELPDKVSVGYNDTNGLDKLSQNIHDGKPCLETSLTTERTKAVVELSRGECKLPSKQAKKNFHEENIEKNLAFLDFKHNNSEGIQFNYFLKGRKLKLREIKQHIQTLSVNMKELKREIHEISCLLESENEENIPIHETIQSRDTGETNNSHQEELRQRLELAKAEYGKSCVELHEAKGEMQNLMKEVLECKQMLLQSFFKQYKSNRNPLHYTTPKD